MNLIKAHSYLIDGKITVKFHSDDSAVMYAEGSEHYLITFNAAGWNCSCPARVECAHVQAAKLISPLRASQHPSLLVNEKVDQEIENFLRS